MLDINKKKDQWIYLNDNLLDAVEINVFHSIFIPKDNEISMETIIRMNNLEEMFLFFSNFSREYLITHLAKIIDFDSNAITIANFFNAVYSDKQGVDHVEFRKWKKATREIREKIRCARNKYSSHADSESFYKKEFFGIYIEDVESFLNHTFILFDYLYNKDPDLQESFDNIIGVGLFPALSPSKLAKSRRVSRAKKIKRLRESIEK